MLTRPGTLIELKIQDINDLKERIKNKAKQLQENEDLNSIQTNLNINSQENNSRILTSQQSNSISSNNNVHN
ncbi:Anaphase-promoting complex APC subunit CDC26 [Cryptosporidium tyzzeri]|nr:Anaphase-promoting complex APC subunit CDC26 [Cryptosporidium tyzzeri]